MATCGLRSGIAALRLLVLVLLSALVATCAVFAPLYQRALEQALLRTGVNAASVADTALVVRAGRNPANPDFGSLALAQQRAAGPGRVLYDRGVGQMSQPLDLVPRKGLVPSPADLVARDGSCEHLRITAGTCPRRPGRCWSPRRTWRRGSGPWARPSSRPSRGPSTPGPVRLATLRVVGAYEVVPDPAYWLTRPSSTASRARSSRRAGASCPPSTTSSPPRRRSPGLARGAGHPDPAAAPRPVHPRQPRPDLQTSSPPRATGLGRGVDGALVETQLPSIIEGHPRGAAPAARHRAAPDGPARPARRAPSCCWSHRPRWSSADPRWPWPGCAGAAARAPVGSSWASSPSRSPSACRLGFLARAAPDQPGAVVPPARRRAVRGAVARRSSPLAARGGRLRRGHLAGRPAGPAADGVLAPAPRGSRERTRAFGVVDVLAVALAAFGLVGPGDRHARGAAGARSRRPSSPWRPGWSRSASPSRSPRPAAAAACGGAGSVPPSRPSGWSADPRCARWSPWSASRSRSPCSPRTPLAVGDRNWAGPRRGADRRPRRHRHRQPQPGQPARHRAALSTRAAPRPAPWPIVRRVDQRRDGDAWPWSPGLRADVAFAPAGRGLPARRPRSAGRRAVAARRARGSPAASPGTSPAPRHRRRAAAAGPVRPAPAARPGHRLRGSRPSCDISVTTPDGQRLTRVIAEVPLQGKGSARPRRPAAVPGRLPARRHRVPQDRPAGQRGLAARSPSPAWGSTESSLGLAAPSQWNPFVPTTSGARDRLELADGPADTLVLDLLSTGFSVERHARRRPRGRARPARWGDPAGRDGGRLRRRRAERRSDPRLVGPGRRHAAGARGKGRARGLRDAGPARGDAARQRHPVGLAARPPVTPALSRRPWPRAASA